MSSSLGCLSGASRHQALQLSWRKLSRLLSHELQTLLIGEHLTFVRLAAIVDLGLFAERPLR